MNSNSSNGHDITTPPEAGAHGHAAILLVESLIHGLVDKQVLSLADAVEIVDVATDVTIESGTELGMLPVTLQGTKNLLEAIGASLRLDLDGQEPQGAPI